MFPLIVHNYLSAQTGILLRVARVECEPKVSQDEKKGRKNHALKFTQFDQLIYIDNFGELHMSNF